jgi:hypothetical protein
VLFLRKVDSALKVETVGIELSSIDFQGFRKLNKIKKIEIKDNLDLIFKITPQLKTSKL